MSTLVTILAVVALCSPMIVLLHAMATLHLPGRLCGFLLNVPHRIEGHDFWAVQRWRDQNNMGVRDIYYYVYEPLSSRNWLGFRLWTLDPFENCDDSELSNKIRAEWAKYKSE